jgi:hypothetical protein
VPRVGSQSAEQEETDLKAKARRGLGNPSRDGGTVMPVDPRRDDGRGAPSFRRLAAVVSLAATAVLLAFAAPALAENPPTVTVGPASEVGVTSVHLSGHVDPEGGAGSPATYWRLALSESEEPGSFGIFGGAGEIDPPASEEANPVAVAATAEDLQPDTEYFVRLVAENGEFANRAETGAPYPSFTTEEATEPVLTAEAPSAVGYTLATLHGSLDPEGGNVNPVGGALPIHWTLQYSPEGEGAWANAGEGEVTGAAAEGTGAIPLEATLPAGTLTQGHAYEFRTVATYLNGSREVTSPGPNPTASTLAATAPSVMIATPTVTAHTATFVGHVNPEAPEAAPTSTDVEAAFRTAWHFQCTPECPGLQGGALAAGYSAQEVTAQTTGLLAGVGYEVTLVAENSAGPVSVGPVAFTTPTAEPTVEHTFVSGLSQTGATLNAEVNPEGAVTTVRFQYLTLAQFEVNEQSEIDPFTGATDTAGSAPIESELNSGHEVSTAVSGLRPGTAYAFRAVATNERSPADSSPGPVARLVTGSNAIPPSETCPNAQRRAEQPYGSQLPDCRAYELVSPPDTNGGDATAFRAAYAARASEALGDAEPAITYSAKGSFGEPEGALLENQYLSRRAPGGWTTQGVTPLYIADATEESSGTYPTTYFTPELTAGLAVTSAQLGESPPLGEHFGVYLAEFADHGYRYVGPTSVKEVPWGASSDLDRVVLTGLGNQSLVEDIGGTEVPVSVTNTGTGLAAGAGSPAASRVSPIFKDAWHSTSEDGSRVYFTSPPYLEENGAPTVGQLYVRTNIGQPQSAVSGEGECIESSKACTIEVSASRRDPEDPAGPKSARYWGASADGSKVFFTSDSELTEDAYTGPADNAANLYEYDLGSGELVDLTGEQFDATGEGAAVQGVATISEDGSYVYFVADGVLATGTGAVQGQPNLYVSHDGGAPVFVATLGGTDVTDWLNSGAEEAGPEINSAVLSPSGGQLAFISERELTGYDNRQAAPGDCEAELGNNERESGACREIFLYESETGRLVCASCNPSSSRPVGGSSLPGVVPASQAYADYRPRDLLADGTLLFESKDALTPGSSGGGRSVYEYEGGVVHAISAPAGGHESFFLDASPDGRNVFFASADRLTAEDPGGNVAVWDAREGGGFPGATSAPCGGGGSCPPAAVPPPAARRAMSMNFSGAGNIAASRPKQSGKAKTDKLNKALKACRKKSPESRRQSCERSARKRYGKKKPKSAGKNGGSNR